jgi:hypothetical protein
VNEITEVLEGGRGIRENDGDIHLTKNVCKYHAVPPVYYYMLTK